VVNSQEKNNPPILEDAENWISRLISKYGYFQISIRILVFTLTLYPLIPLWKSDRTCFFIYLGGVFALAFIIYVCLELSEIKRQLKKNLKDAISVMPHDCEKEKKEFNYVFLEYNKHITLYKDRQGIIIFGGKIKKTGKDFREIDSWFDLGGYADNILEFKSFKDLRENYKKRPKNRFTDQTLFGKILYIDDEAVASEDEELELNEFIDPLVDIKRRRSFKIKFPFNIKTLKGKSKTFSENTVIDYRVGWSADKLYPTNQEEVKYTHDFIKGKKLDWHGESIFTVRHPILKVKFSVAFEQGIKINDIKLMRNSEEIDSNKLKVQNDLFYSKYFFEDEGVPTIGDNYYIRWRYAD
jgi:uncharacterized Zn ribbon protein